MQTGRLCTLLALALCWGCNNDPWQPGEARQNAIFSTFGDITSYDPSVSYNSDDAGVMDLIYPSFYRYRYPSRERLRIELNLGEEEPKVEDGPFGETWTFRIRPDIRFQDDPCFAGGKGRPVTANDIVYAFKRMADPKTISPVADFLSDKVIGWKSYADGFAKLGRSHYDDKIPGIRMDPRDPYRFTVRLSEPYPQLRYVMAMHFTTPIPREAVEKYGDDFSILHPVGCGPYMVQELRPRDRMVLVRNPNCTWARNPAKYEAGDDPDLLKLGPIRLPAADKIAFIGLRESLTSYNLFQQGYIDSVSAGYSNAQIIRGATGLGPDMKARGIRLFSDSEPDYFFLAFNMEDSQYGGYSPEHRKLRQAISLAIDADSYIQIICQGLGRRAEFSIPPGLLGYDAGYRNPYRNFQPDLAKSKELLKEAGYANGVDPTNGQKLVLHLDNYSTSPTTRQMVRLFQIQIERLGVKVELRSTTFELYKARLNKHQNQFFFGSWVGDYPDPENFLSTMYGPNSAPGPNESNYHNPEFDRLFLQFRSMKDSPKRFELIRRARDIEVQDCAIIPLSYGETRTLLNPWVRNAKPNPIANDTFNYWAVTPSMRVAAQQAWNSPRLWPLAALGCLGIALGIPAGAAVRRHKRRRVRRGNR